MKTSALKVVGWGSRHTNKVLNIINRCSAAEKEANLGSLTPEFKSWLCLPLDM